MTSEVEFPGEVATAGAARLRVLSSLEQPVFRRPSSRR
jgi:hypothetical protein